MSLQYDREELYQKVWEKPLLRVAGGSNPPPATIYGFEGLPA